MAITPIKALLFLAGGTVAAAGTAYVSGALDPYFTTRPAAVVSLPDAPQDKADATVARLPAQEPVVAAPTPDAPPADAAAAPEATASPDDIVAPSFDVVRVESDGSIVVAGKAEPGAKVEMVIGSDVIGKAVAGPGGDFAAVLEDPLDPGGYQIVLRSTTPDNVVAMSVETAVVSVPETENGQVLALVEEPGKPSELITVPEPEPTPELPAAGAAPEQPAVAAPPAAEDPASQPAGEQPAAADPEPSDQMEAALQPDPAPSVEPGAAVPAQPMVTVEAVEIEGRTIFVAGAADPGRKVRGYANEILLGDAEVSPNGRFLIEAERDLPVGDYIIRVDALEPNGNEVAARAAVPFEREPGEAIAAVAPPAPVQTPAPEAPAAETDPGAEEPAVAQAPAPETEMGEPAPAPVETPPAVAAAPDTKPAAVAEAPVQTPAPETPAAETNPGAEEPAVAQAPAPETAATESEPAPAVTPPAVAEAPAVEETPSAAPAPATETAPAETDTAMAETPQVDSGAAKTPPAEPVAPAATPAPDPEIEVAEAPGDGVTETAEQAQDVPTTTAPKLQSVDSAVIIRRGDTLWRISRRVYGKGIRYSTIYLANETQIEDPDRIWPGQVFAVPEKTSEGVAADMTRMGDQATTVPQ